jgi:hypothetical protein
MEVLRAPWRGLKIPEGGKLVSFALSFISRVALVFLFVCLGGTRIELRASQLVRQVLYHLNHAPSPFTFSLFFRNGLTLLPGLTSD